ncbi:hypothetical protein NESM_000225000 [Novymonas esmeraldas]|uniref:Uncharacterized protein n=1 Tax=Novymonas esmeraldas TaxID=1808958 RepID=A0AAW0F7M5_9TRYP
MAYIHNGRVVDKKPFTVRGFLVALWTTLSLFAQTLFTTQPVAQVVEEHRNPAQRAARAPDNGGGGVLGWLRGLLNRRRGGGGGGGQVLGGGRSSWAAGVNRNGANVHTLPKGSISGGCASG